MEPLEDGELSAGTDLSNHGFCDGIGACFEVVKKEGGVSGP